MSRNTSSKLNFQGVDAYTNGSKVIQGSAKPLLILVSCMFFDNDPWELTFSSNGSVFRSLAIFEPLVQFRSVESVTPLYNDATRLNHLNSLTVKQDWKTFNCTLKLNPLPSTSKKEPYFTWEFSFTRTNLKSRRFT